MDCPVQVRRLFHRLFLLEVVWDDDAGDSAFGLGDPHCAINQVAQLRCLSGHMNVFMRDVLEQ